MPPVADTYRISRLPRCHRCRLRGPLCLCHEIPRVETGLSFLVIQHLLETRKNSNTGRLAAAALPGCRLLEFGRRDHPFDETLVPGSAWLLFPPEQDQRGEETGRHRVLTGRSMEAPGTFVVLDGTWGQTRRMSHRISILDRLPRFLLEPSGSAPDRLRRSHDPRAFSTIEAIARVIELFEGVEKARVLDRIHAEFVRRHRLVGRRTGNRMAPGANVEKN